MKPENTTATIGENVTRVLVLGSADWSSHRQTVAALRKVMTTFRDPYTLVCDMSDGAARYAAAGARQLGWKVEPHEVDPAKCGPDCPTTGNHRKRGGPTGDWCPTAKTRNLAAMVDSRPDICLVFVRPSGRSSGVRLGQAVVRARDIGIWTFTHTTKKENRDGDETE